MMPGLERGVAYAQSVPVLHAEPLIRGADVHVAHEGLKEERCQRQRAAEKRSGAEHLRIGWGTHQEDVDAEVCAATALEEDRQRGDQDGEAEEKRTGQVVPPFESPTW